MSNISNTNAPDRYSERITSYDEIQPDYEPTVKPIKRAKPSVLPIVAVCPDHSVLCEATNEHLSFEDYCRSVPYMRRHMVVTFSPDGWLWLLHEQWKHDPMWTWRVTVQEKPRNSQRQHVAYYGFRRSNKSAFSNLVLDAASFTHDFDTDLIELGAWVRDFCTTYGLKLRASAAGIAAQLLRHPDFYPEARRAVPRFINSTARKNLPGPYYESYVSTAQRMTAATYIDQEAAYHYAAMTTPLPNANSIHATGLTRSTHMYARAGGELFERELRKHGLVHVGITVPENLSPKEQLFLPRTMRAPGAHEAWLWTNEIPYLKSFGMTIEYLISAWGTSETDTSIARYANWARAVSRGNPHLKALLLMPYGTLGRRPDRVKVHSPGGENDLLLAGQWVEGTCSYGAGVPTYTSNALQLGLIQAHVRTLSLDMARQLSAKDDEVISIYSDGIFVRMDESRQVPLFAPWRLKEDNLELHLSESLRIPVRNIVRREYLAVDKPQHKGAL